jgi:hypothetical protein
MPCPARPLLPRARAPPLASPRPPADPRLPPGAARPPRRRHRNDRLVHLLHQRRWPQPLRRLPVYAHQILLRPGRHRRHHHDRLGLADRDRPGVVPEGNKVKSALSTDCVTGDCLLSDHDLVLLDDYGVNAVFVRKQYRLYEVVEDV